MLFAASTWADAFAIWGSLLTSVFIFLKQWWDASQRKTIAEKLQTTIDQKTEQQTAEIKGALKSEAAGVKSDVKATTAKAVENVAAMGSGGGK